MDPVLLPALIRRRDRADGSGSITGVEGGLPTVPPSLRLVGVPLLVILLWLLW